MAETRKPGNSRRTTFWPPRVPAGHVGGRQRRAAARAALRSDPGAGWLGVFLLVILVLRQPR
jgi:hypothetical protein